MGGSCWSRDKCFSYCWGVWKICLPWRWDWISLISADLCLGIFLTVSCIIQVMSIACTTLLTCTTMLHLLCWCCGQNCNSVCSMTLVSSCMQFFWLFGNLLNSGIYFIQLRAFQERILEWSNTAWMAFMMSQKPPIAFLMTLEILVRLQFFFLFCKICLWWFNDLSLIIVFFFFLNSILFTIVLSTASQPIGKMSVQNADCVRILECSECIRLFLVYFDVLEWFMRCLLYFYVWLKFQSLSCGIQNLSKLCSNGTHGICCNILRKCIISSYNTWQFVKIQLKLFFFLLIPILPKKQSCSASLGFPVINAVKRHAGHDAIAHKFTLEQSHPLGSHHHRMTVNVSTV